MSIVPRLELGPADHGRALTLEEFLSAEYSGGYQYEIIRGRLYVSPKPNLPAGILERWVYRSLDRYSDERPEVINMVFPGARIFVAEEAEVTAPEPDVAAFRDFPSERPSSELNWEDVSPLIVVEVLSKNHPDKDLVRNVELYLLVPSIREYWVVDGREDADRPTFIVHRRHGKRWVVRQYYYGDTYTTRLLPGFELVIAPRR